MQNQIGAVLSLFSFSDMNKSWLKPIIQVLIQPFNYWIKAKEPAKGGGEDRLEREEVRGGRGGSRERSVGSLKAKKFKDWGGGGELVKEVGAIFR